jgi:hypothetical protein
VTSDTKDRILDASRTLLQHQGYAGTGIKQSGVGLFHRRADRLEGLDAEGCEQVILGLEVAVASGRDRPGLSRDRSQG